MSLMRSITKRCHELECSICYKSINKTYFECGAPCGKIFHTGCIEKMMEQTEEAAYESDEEPNYRCCYCRRNIDENNCLLQHFAHRLLILHKESYDVRDALNRVKFLMTTNGKPEEDESFEYYQLINIVYVKKPKQPNREILKKHVRAPRLIRSNQNIGGRRR
jgi:hypothetical protein